MPHSPPPHLGCGCSFGRGQQAQRPPGPPGLGRCKRVAAIAFAVQAAAVGSAAAQPVAPTQPMPDATAAPPTSALATASASNLAALPPGVLEQGVALLKQAAQTLAPKGARVVATAGAPGLRLKLGPCSAGTAYLVPGVPAWGASRVGLRCTQGAAWNIQLPVKVQVFAPAVVAATALSSGTSLSMTQLALAEADWGAHGAPAALVSPGGGNGASLFGDIQLLEGRVLSRPAAAGAPVKAADLQVRQWFAAGTTVSVVALGGGFSVVTEGQALSAGLEGQLVRVRTEGGRVVAGHATGERRVEVRL